MPIASATSYGITGSERLGDTTVRLATIRQSGETFAARVEGDVAVRLPYADVGDLLRSAGDWKRSATEAAGSVHYLKSCELAPVVLRPQKIICLGLNYRGHILEMGRDLPRFPTLFAKFARALVGAYDPIQLPIVSDQVDWEAELGVIVGTSIRHASRAEAEAGIAGFVVANDITVRDWQHRTREFLSGKTFESTTPVGPALVTPDEDLGPEPDLKITCAVDGTVMQEARTSELLFSPGEIISYVSDIITLEPGDLILTGTPGGVGVARRPPIFLADGMSVRTEVEGVGVLTNLCVAEATREAEAGSP